MFICVQNKIFVNEAISVGDYHPLHNLFCHTKRNNCAGMDDDKVPTYDKEEDKTFYDKLQYGHAKYSLNQKVRHD